MPGMNVQRYPRYPTQAPVDILGLAKENAQRLVLGNISLGGAFVRDLTGVPLGSNLSIRIAVGEGIVAQVRTVHVIAPEVAARHGRVQGTGFKFERFGLGAQSRLQDFVGVEAQRVVPAGYDSNLMLAVLVAPNALEIAFKSPAQLTRLWEKELSKSRVFVYTTARFALRAAVQLRLRAAHGVGVLPAEVVHQLPGVAGAVSGLGLQLLGGAATQEKLFTFVQQRQVVSPPAVDASQLTEVLEEARRFLGGLEHGPVTTALGLSTAASALDGQRRLSELKRLFALQLEGITAPQQARLDAAARALTQVERQWAVRERQVPGSLALSQEEQPPANEVAESPIETPVNTTQEELARAEELLAQADVFLTTDMVLEARKMAYEALELRCSEALLLRAMAVLHAAGDSSRACSIGNSLVQQNSRNKKAWALLLDIHEGKKQLGLAIRAAEMVVRLDSQDSRTKQRLAQLKRLAASR